MVLVSSISNFFTHKTSLANKWMSFSSSNSTLDELSLLIHFLIHNSFKNHALKCVCKGLFHLDDKIIWWLYNVKKTIYTSVFAIIFLVICIGRISIFIEYYHQCISSYLFYMPILQIMLLNCKSWHWEERYMMGL